MHVRSILNFNIRIRVDLRLQLGLGSDLDLGSGLDFGQLGIGLWLEWYLGLWSSSVLSIQWMITGRIHFEIE